MERRRLFTALAAAAMTAMVSLTAWAETGEVSVTVDNVPGGAMAFYYTDGNTWRYLPIGETVKIPEGSTLEWDVETLDGVYLEELDDYVYPELKSLTVVSGESTEVHVNNEFEDDGYEIPDDFTVTEDTVFTPKFQAYAEVWGGDSAQNSRYRLLPNKKRYDSPAMADIEITVKKDGTETPLSKNDGWEIVSVGSSINAGGAEVDETSFEVTEKGIVSTDELPLGSHTLRLQKSGDEERTYTFTIYVGASANREIVLAEYKDSEDNEIFPLVTATRHLQLEGKWCFDKATTSVGHLVGMADVSVSEGNIDEVVGYEIEAGIWRDDDGKNISVNDARLLKDVMESSSYYFLHPVVKKGAKEFKPVMVKTPSADDVILRYYDYWVEKDGKLYYYDDTGMPARNEWHKKDGKDYFCGSAGWVMTDGVVGKPGYDLRLVDKNGAVMESFTGEKTIGMVKYGIENGRVVSQTVIEIATPSDAAKLEDLAKNIITAVRGTMTEDQLLAAGDMLAYGLREKLSEGAKEKLTVYQLQIYDEALMFAYGIESEGVGLDNSEVSGEDSLNMDMTSFAGILLASGITSETRDGAQIGIQMSQLPAVGTDSNATQLVRYELVLMVNGEEIQPMTPIIATLGMPERFVREYNPAKYNYIVTHIHRNSDGEEEKETYKIVFNADGSEGKYRIDKLSEFIISRKLKSSPKRYSGGSSGGRSGTLLGVWEQDEIGWRYRLYNNASYVKGQWWEIPWKGANYWYNFNKDGYMTTGWILDNGFWYYLNPAKDGNSGYMFTGWHEIDGKWYYFNDQAGMPRGAMLSDTQTPDGYYVNSDGVWTPQP